MRALCALKQAYAYALADDAAACERSLADAYAVLDSADAARSPWDDLARQEVAPSYLRAADGRCWLSLQPRKAVATLEDVVHGWPSDRTRDRGVQQARLALACAAADEPDCAAAEGIEAVKIAEHTKSDVTLRELRRLDRRLAAYDVAAATDFREALAVL